MCVKSILSDVGVKEYQPIAICIPRSPALVAAVLGCVLHGAVFLLVDPSLPAQRIKLLLEISRPALLLYNLKYHSTLRHVLSIISSIPKLPVSTEENQIKFCTVSQSDRSKGIIVTENFQCGSDVCTSSSLLAPLVFPRQHPVH